MVTEEKDKSNLPKTLFAFNALYFKKVKALFGSSPAVSEGCPRKENAGKGEDPHLRLEGNGQSNDEPGKSLF